MRRKDREVTDPVKIEEILRSCKICRLGFCDEGEVYIVPLNFGCVLRDGKYTLYFHGAQEGRKMDLIRKNPRVGFETDVGFALTEGQRACDYSARFQSIIGNGRVSIVTDREEKQFGLSVLMQQFTGKGDWSFEEAMLREVAVFKLEVESLSCKEHE